jgi:alanyl-tRNA synthetase
LTDRLYYRDPALLDFDAEIVATGQRDEGDYYTILDRSAFYPTSGGQMHDTGRMNDCKIVDVIEDDHGEVLHISEQPVGKPGDAVNGTVDRERRQHNRRMHTAQHILSGAFYKLDNRTTMSVHLGEEYGAVELNTEELSDKLLWEAEEMANEIVDLNYPVDILFVEGNEVDQLPLRKPPSREGTLRIIKIDDYDWSACGGTHCSSTAEIGLIKIIGTERIRGRILVKFLVGLGALDDYRKRFNATEELIRTFTCHVTDLPSKVEKLLDENKSLKKDVADLQKELLPIRAEHLATEAINSGPIPVLAGVIDDLDVSTAGRLATLTADKVRGVVVFCVGDKLVLTTGSDSGIHAGELMKKLVAATGLRGGGGQTMAQAGGAECGSLKTYRDLVLGLVGDA